ncbi:MAG: T9SS type A sorting domain-containing protein [Bacteroidales bacterium]|nr:T9SS type A sorting domain-containing protein [Bacteroidales bacterium]
MKKLLFFFGLLCMINLMFAQQTVTIHQNGHDFQVSAVRSVTDYPAENIQFWVGSGSNSIVAVFQWCQNETMGIAYGYRWDGTATVQDMLTAIDAADNRFTISISGSMISTYSYQDDTYNEYVETAGWMTYTINGSWCSGLSDALVNNGYFEMQEWGDCTLPTTNIIPATDPNGGTPTDPVDASLPFNQILYWVGSGSNSAEFIVNFAQPDTAFAWGYRFDGTTTAQAMVDAIAAADPRFWTEGSPSLGGDIHFVLDNGDTLGLSPVDPNVGYNFWWTNLNGVSADAGASSTLHNGDVFKYGDMNSAIGWDFQYGYYMQEAWVKMPTPVTPPATPVEPDTLCTTIHPLTYSEDFSSYTSDQSIRPYFASAPIPECWTVLGNGTVHHVGTGSSTTGDYFGGVGYSTSTNSFGAIAANDAFFAFIASQIYTGNNTNYINDMLTTGTRRYAVLPAFDAPLSQTVLTFDHRTNIADANTHLVVGYIVNDTADFVALETYTADNKVLHHDTIHFNQYANVPADARLTLMWDVASTTASTTGPGNRYCGIDNLTVALDDTTPVIPVPEEATIAFSDILFWVGTGSNEAVMAVNWADTALAWGYRWDGTATVADMMNHIAAADPRFSFTGTGMVSDINYIDTAAGMTTPLGITPGNWWGSTNNGVMDMGMAQTLSNGDLEKWADSSTGILVDSVWVDEWGGYWNYIYVYPMTIYPVTVPDTTGGGTPPDPEHGPFCGGVGTEGCNAIAVDDNQIVAWATSVVLTRGPQDISNPNSPAVTFGDETNAIGPATPNNSMDAVSLGDGGSALVTFERPIQNGEGPDFAVFENDNNGGFLELAFVEVSSDGVHFVRFPATSLTPTETQVGTFGFVDPTFINNLAGKFQIGYGTPFDLEELAGSENLNIDSIVYVRIVDVVGSIDPQYGSYDAFGHIVNDPWPTDFWSSGFDLTGVGVIHQKPVGIDNHEMPQVFAYPNPCNGTLYIINENAERVELYNMNGQLLEMVNSGDTHITLNMQSYPAGLYLLKVGNGVQKILKK